MSLCIITLKISKIVRSWSAQALNVRRRDFDQFLMNLVKTEIGTTVIEDCRLIKVMVNQDYADCVFSTGLQIRAAIVIGCAVLIQLQFEIWPVSVKGKHVATAVRTYVHGIADLKEGINEVPLLKKFQPDTFRYFPRQRVGRM